MAIAGRRPADRAPPALLPTLATATARAFPALYADPHDRRLLELEGPQADQERLLYVLTLGVQQVRRGPCWPVFAAG